MFWLRNKNNDCQLRTLNLCEGLNEPIHEILKLIALSRNEGSSEPAQLYRPARAFAAGIHKAWMKIKIHTNH